MSNPLSASLDQNEKTPNLTDENTIVAFLNKKVDNIATNITGIVPPHELDIYLPDYNVAIEFNGLLQHSEEQGKGKWYHHDKWLACKNAGIQLIQIWEDDWTRDPRKIETMLAHKLGFSGQQKVYARNTIIVHLPDVDTREYLEEHHIQGYTQGGIRLGLINKKDGELVSLMILKREPGSDGKVLNLLRFATSRQVTGGFTKLLSYAERVYSPNSIVTFSDNAVSDGGLYENTGFVNVKELDPDYMYVSKGQRIHKFNYRLKRFREDPELLWDESLSERQLAQWNNLPRVWDSGKIKWEKKFNEPL